MAGLCDVRTQCPAYRPRHSQRSPARRVRDRGGQMPDEAKGGLAPIAERSTRVWILAPVVVGALLGLSSLAGAADVPLLRAGRVASMAGSRVSCQARATSVTCKKAG